MRESLPDEFLNAFAFVGLGDEEIAARIGRQIVRAVELARPVPRAAERVDDFERVPPHDVYLLIRAVDHDEKRLVRIVREGDVPHRSAAERILRDELLLDEAAVLSKHLD